MSIKINNTAVFTTSGGSVTLDINEVWIDLDIKLPAGVNAKGIVKMKVYKDNTRINLVKDIDHLNTINDLDLQSLIAGDYWTDINAGSVTDAVIAKLIERNPLWDGKITKELHI
jgi:hypothetical protein